MKKSVGLLLLIALIVSLLSMVGCVSVMENSMAGCVSIMADVHVREDLRPIHETAYDDAYDDANVEIWLWSVGGLCLGFGGGCLLGPLGIVTAHHFYEPSPPPTRLLGKPPEYVDYYVGTYKAVRRNVALSSTVLGCAAGAVTGGCLVTPWVTVLGTFVGRVADQAGW